MASGESGLKTRILEVVRGTKEQKEPLLAGSEYELTKKVIQSYEEQKKYLTGKLDECKAKLIECNRQGRRSIVVDKGYVVKGYGLLIALRDDLDLIAELTAAIDSMKTTYSFEKYLATRKGNHAQLVMDPYLVQELSLIFPGFLTYNIVSEMENMVESTKAAYGVQVYTQALRSVDEAIGYEANASMIVGNKELAERLKDSDTTLLVSLAAGAQQDAKPEKVRQPKEPTREEVERGLQELANKQLELQTPSSIAEFPADTDKSVGVDVVNGRNQKKRVKAKEKPKPAKAAVKKAST